MNKAQTKTIIDESIVDFIDTCPHCGTKAHFKMLFNESYQQKNKDVIYYVIFKCVPCKKLILETHRFAQNRYSSTEDLASAGWEDKFPANEAILVSKFEDSVPQEVLEDFKEGVICLSNNCPRAAVAMFRRALQSALLERGANSKEELVDQIKNASFLTQDIKDWSHNIRIFGNWGAHPQDDNLKEADEKIADETQSFLEEFFNYVYVMPSRVLVARQKSVSTPTPKSKN